MAEFGCAVANGCRMSSAPSMSPRARRETPSTSKAMGWSPTALMISAACSPARTGSVASKREAWANAVSRVATGSAAAFKSAHLRESRSAKQPEWLRLSVFSRFRASLQHSDDGQFALQRFQQSIVELQGLIVGLHQNALVLAVGAVVVHIVGNAVEYVDRHA